MDLASIQTTYFNKGTKQRSNLRSQRALVPLFRRPNRECRKNFAVSTVSRAAKPGSTRNSYFILEESKETDGLDWVRNSIAYQIFPDRFAPLPGSKYSKDFNFARWGSPPALRDFQGGHLLGIVDKLDYLKNLGINLLYLTPVNTSSANHRYHPTDFMSVDPLLGGEAGFSQLLREAEAAGMRVVVDGVFNHTGRGHPAFVSLMENHQASPYRDWFTVHKWPVDAYKDEALGPPNYDCWWDIPELPELNYSSPSVRSHILDVGRAWLDRGCAGWRLDAPTRVPRDFWRDFREVCKETRKDSYLVGEVFGLNPDWCGSSAFDGLMNYDFGSLGLGLFGDAELQQDEAIGGEYVINQLDVPTFAIGVERMLAAYSSVQAPHPAFLHMNLFGSHDTARALWMLKGEKTALRMTTLFMMTMPGMPLIYYGDEIGLMGGRDPENRAAFPWETPVTWDTKLLAFFRAATKLRNTYQVLRVGGFQRAPIISASPDGAPATELYAFQRWSTDSQSKLSFSALVVFNTANQSAKDVQINLKGSAVGDQRGTIFINVWNEGKLGEGIACTVREDEFLVIPEVPGRDGAVLMAMNVETVDST